MSFRVKIGRCRLELGFSCFLAAAFACLFLPGETPALFFSMALHEGGHLAAMRALGVVPRRVTVSAMGLRIVLPEGRALSRGQEALVSAAGPGVNLFCFLACWAAGRPGTPFALSSLVLGVLHLLPIAPLDGGLIVERFFGARVSRWVSAAFLIPLGALGFFILLRTRYNYSLLALSVYLMLYLVLGEDYGC